MQSINGTSNQPQVSASRCGLCAVVASVLFNVALVSGSDSAANRPLNILVITADNLGYGDLQCYNSKSKTRTPNLDRLATQGARLTGFYTASPTCTVSRACLLTGRIPQRHGLTDQLGGVAGNYGVGLSHDEILIPQILRKAPTPYATGCFGKWNIGFAEGSRPTERGFDEFIGHASGNLDYYFHNYREKHDLYHGTKELHREGEYSTDIFADAAIDFMRRKSKTNQPWFCYVPFNSPHFPTAGNKIRGEANVWQAPHWAFESCGYSPDEPDPQKRYEAVVYSLDVAIGRVLSALDQTGTADNTFVFFMSDNGAFRLNRKGLDVGSNEPLRHGGVTCWEGGLRVAAMARWPGRVKPGSVIAHPFWSPDLLPACANLAEAELPAEVVFDGEDPLPILRGSASSPHKSLYFEYRSHAALRQGEWKIVRDKRNRPWQLFNIATDQSEARNVADSRPEIVKKLAEDFGRWQDSF